MERNDKHQITGVGVGVAFIIVASLIAAIVCIHWKCRFRRKQQKRASPSTSEIPETGGQINSGYNHDTSDTTGIGESHQNGPHNNSLSGPKTLDKRYETTSDTNSAVVIARKRDPGIQSTQRSDERVSLNMIFPQCQSDADGQNSLYSDMMSVFDERRLYLFLGQKGKECLESKENVYEECMSQSPSPVESETTNVYEEMSSTATGHSDNKNNAQAKTYNNKKAASANGMERNPSKENAIPKNSSNDVHASVYEEPDMPLFQDENGSPSTPEDCAARFTITFADKRKCIIMLNPLSEHFGSPENIHGGVNQTPFESLGSVNNSTSVVGSSGKGVAYSRETSKEPYECEGTKAEEPEKEVPPKIKDSSVNTRDSGINSFIERTPNESLCSVNKSTSVFGSSGKGVAFSTETSRKPDECLQTKAGEPDGFEHTKAEETDECEHTKAEETDECEHTKAGEPDGFEHTKAEETDECEHTKAGEPDGFEHTKAEETDECEHTKALETGGFEHTKADEPDGFEHTVFESYGKDVAYSRETSRKPYECEETKAEETEKEIPLKIRDSNVSTRDSGINSFIE